MKTSDYTIFLTLLTEKRKEKNLTQQELAKTLEKPQSFVSKYESGERRIDVIELLNICKCMEIPIEKFVKELKDRMQ